MSELTETSGRPLASTTTQQPQLPEGNTIHPPTSTHTRHRKNSQSPDEQSKASNNTTSHHLPGTVKQASPGPHVGSSRSEQRSTASPMNMASQLSSVHYTRTGRISKAKKGLKVHNCENCGRVSYIPFHVSALLPPTKAASLGTRLCDCDNTWSFPYCHSIAPSLPCNAVANFFQSYTRAEHLRFVCPCHMQ